MQGEQFGSVFCVKASDAVAKLRLLLVDPNSRLTHKICHKLFAAGFF